MQRAVAQAVDQFGRLDVVIANAGVALAPRHFRTTPSERFERVLEVNLSGVHRTVAAALGPVTERRGQIVLISSIYAFSNGMAEAPYAMSKAAVEQFGRALRAELAPSRCRRHRRLLRVHRHRHGQRRAGPRPACRRAPRRASRARCAAVCRAAAGRGRRSPTRSNDAQARANPPAPLDRDVDAPRSERAAARMRAIVRNAKNAGLLRAIDERGRR